MSAGPTTPRHVTFETRPAAPGTPTQSPVRSSRATAPVAARAAAPGPAPVPARAVPAAPTPTWRAHADVAVAAALILVAAGARILPAGATRLMLTLPVLLVVPGYLLLQALRSHVADHRLQDLLIGIGLSLPVVGLAALLTSMAPNGFTPTAIVTVTTLVCVGLAVTAVLRRHAVRPAPA